MPHDLPPARYAGAQNALRLKRATEGLGDKTSESLGNDAGLGYVAVEGPGCSYAIAHGPFMSKITNGYPIPVTPKMLDYVYYLLYVEEAKEACFF